MADPGKAAQNPGRSACSLDPVFAASSQSSLIACLPVFEPPGGLQAGTLLDPVQLAQLLHNIPNYCARVSVQGSTLQR